ncbi:anti sigma-E protein, RseA [Microbulbifer marinus]|uniref:Anti sigma-E protein, RseA n=2 Tax=Microbulbifer marinus TaxID=658218 RepID=A0A1H3WL88_9GAMM|nr:anti sigma-E protein, RseA [Microbulbifer marinus]
MSHGNHHDRLNESLSALMDGEVSELELQRLLKASSSSAEVSARWSRYQLAASVMRREQVAPVDTGLAASISAAVEREEPLAQSGGGAEAADGLANSRWWRPLSRGAVAATVAFAAILGVQQLQLSSADRGVQSGGELVAEVERPAQQVVQSSPQPTGFYVPAPSTRSVSTASPRLVPDSQPGVAGQAVIQQMPTPELMRHLNRVMIQHSEQAAHVGSQGMVPFARATYGEQVGL